MCQITHSTLICLLLFAPLPSLADIHPLINCTLSEPCSATVKAVQEQTVDKEGLQPPYQVQLEVMPNPSQLMTFNTTSTVRVEPGSEVWVYLKVTKKGKIVELIK